GRTALMRERTPDDERLGKLMQAVQAADADAYLALLHEVAPRVRQLVARRLGTKRSEVEDIVQDVLLSIHVARASYDPARPFLPWLLAIARNRLADAARRGARHAAHEVQVDDLDVTFPQPVAKSSSEGIGDVDVLRQAVQALPIRQRQAIILLKVRELSLKEAAAATGMTVGALKIAPHRAIAALRRLLTAAGTHGD